MTSDDTPKPGPEAAQESPAKPESKGMVLKMRGGGQGGPRLTPELMRQAEVAGQAMGFTQRQAEEPPAAAPAHGLPIPAAPAPMPVQPALSTQATPRRPHRRGRFTRLRCRHASLCAGAAPSTPRS